MQRLRCVFPVLAAILFPIVSGPGCAAPGDEIVADSQQHLNEDPSATPTVLTVPIRFTKNTPDDVGVGFWTQWFRRPGHEKMDGYGWGYNWPKVTKTLKSWYEPDQPGAGYATAKFDIEIPFDTAGRHLYDRARGALEREYIRTLVQTPIKSWSALRVRAGDDLPCLSVTMAAALQGPLRAVSPPYKDEGGTGHEWTGREMINDLPIYKVIVGTLVFSPYCWPTDADGSTRVSVGAAAPPGAFAMVDKEPGQGNTEYATIHFNLLENVAGEMMVGDMYSANKLILNQRDRQKFDDAVKAFGPRFSKDADKGSMDAWGFVP